MTRQPTITDDDIFALLGAAAEYDGRRVATADLNTWQQAANRAHWTYDDALDAIHEHYTHHTEWIRPAHITQQIRRHRAQPPKAELPALPGAHAHPDHRDRIATWARQQLQLDRETRGDRAQQALTITCPTCSAPPGDQRWRVLPNGQPCRNDLYGKPVPPGTRQQITDPHHRRVQLANN